MSIYDTSEIKDGEIFLWNVDVNEKGDVEEKKYRKGEHEKFKTLREGIQALDIHGKKLNSKYIRPQFIHKSEYLAHQKWIEEKWEEYKKNN